MIKRKFLTTIVLCLVMLLSVIPVYGAPANTTKLTDEAIGNLKVKFNSEGVPKDKQELLIQKIMNGELIDSINPEKLNAIPQDFFLYQTLIQKKNMFSLTVHM
ncbi:hypothetical protein JCM15765_19660 [Paradesulfitobacterium aromaticivorans]